MSSRLFATKLAIFTGFVLGCGPQPGGSANGSAASGGAPAIETASGGTSSTTAESQNTNELDTDDEYLAFMQTITPSLLDVLIALGDRDSPVDNVACSGGGTAAIDRGLGQVIFSACVLGDVIVSGAGVSAQGASSESTQSILLAGAELTLGGSAFGMTLIVLAELFYQEPRSSENTSFVATFQQNSTTSVCVQSSGEPC